MKDVLKMVCTEFNVSPFAVLTEDRTRPLPDVRKAFAHIMLNHTRELYTSVEIGKFIQRDHSSVLTANNRAIDLIQTEPSFCARVNNVIEKIKLNYMDFNAIPQF